MPAVVNSQQGAVGTTAATTQAITPTGIVPGRSLIVLVANAGGAATGVVTACSDTGGNTYTVPDPPNGGVASVTNTQMAVAYCHNCVAPGTITVTMGSIAQRKILLLEVSGLLNATADAAAEDVVAATSLTNVAPAVTLSAPALAIAVCSRGGTANPTGITAGWTASTAGLPDLTAPILRAGWQEFAAAGSTGTCGFTYALSAQAGLGMIAFRVALLRSRSVSVRRVGAGR